MSKLVKTMLLGVAAVVVGFTGQRAVAGESFPNVYDLTTGFDQFLGAKYEVGSDSNSRLIWDYFNPTPFTYLGSVLWILNPQGQVVAAGDTQIPMSVGTGINTLGTSNIAIRVQASGNVTVAFAHVVTPATTTTQAVVDGFSTWTYNAQGKLIAFGGPYGPFGSATALFGLAFDKNGILVAKWVNVTANISWAAWTLDEFGKVQTAAGPFGFGSSTNILLGKVEASQVNGKPVQLWNWILEPASQTFGLNTWTLDQTGNIIASNSFGPF
jgi:hypothetical protein